MKTLYYLSSIITSFPLQAEGFGRTISEALIMKKKILTFNYGGVKDQLDKLDDIYKVYPHKYNEIDVKLQNIIKIDKEKFSNISLDSFQLPSQILFTILELFTNGFREINEGVNPRKT